MSEPGYAQVVTWNAKCLIALCRDGTVRNCFPSDTGFHDKEVRQLFDITAILAYNEEYLLALKDTGTSAILFGMKKADRKTFEQDFTPALFPHQYS